LPVDYSYLFLNKPSVSVWEERTYYICPYLIQAQFFIFFSVTAGQGLLGPVFISNPLFRKVCLYFYFKFVLHHLPSFVKIISVILIFVYLLYGWGAKK